MLEDYSMRHYDVIVDEFCKLHGERSYAFQYHNENFIRWNSVCEGCLTSRRSRNMTTAQEGRKEEDNDK